MPQIKSGPKALNKLLEEVFSDCMLKNHDDISCSKQAWGAAKNAGWHKDSKGNWFKSK